ncbi:MAG: amidohydrolase family protein [Planctomycetota bacterium]|nr:amidohydrolase family protein [Planctomycetota bacterium]
MESKKAQAPRFLQPEATLLGDTLLHGVVLALDSKGEVRALPPGESPSSPVEVFEGECWTQSPVLAHAHLENFDAPSSDWPRQPFADWVRSLLAWRSEDSRLSPSDSAHRSLEELKQNGCGGVLAHMSEPGANSLPHERDELFPHLRCWSEIFEPGEAMSRELRELLQKTEGVALHAPFSVSQSVAKWVFQNQLHVSIHLGEHSDEREFLEYGSGPLAHLFEERGRPIPEGRFSSSVDWLEAVGGLRPGTLAVHCTNLKKEEFQRLEEAGVSIAWCPGTQRYFCRETPDFSGALSKPPLLGCDSMASNEVLDPMWEYRLACELVPGFSPLEWWTSLTQTGAEALNLTGLPLLRWEMGGHPLPVDAEAFCQWLSSEEAPGHGNLFPLS